jgi:hypothetical protein
MYANITVQLQDKRVLLYKENAHRPWDLTIKQLVGSSKQSLDLANSILWNTFGIDPNRYSDDFVEIRRYNRIESSKREAITIYVMKLKAALAFQVEPEERFVACRWMDVLEDITRKAVFIEHDPIPKYTQHAILIAQTLNVRGVFK